MKLFKIKYVLKNNSSMSVGILANNREESIKYLMNNQKDIRTIESIMIGDDIHAIENSIIDTYINKNDKIKRLKGDIQYLKNCLMESDEIIENLRSAPVVSPVNVNEIGMLHEKIVQLETEKMELLENSSKGLEDLEAENRKLHEQIKLLNDKPKDLGESFVCTECSQVCKTAIALKQHYTKMHKEK